MESFNKKFILILFSIALLVGFLHSLPMIYVRLRLGSDYKGIFPLQSADEEHYDVCIKMAMDGYYYNKNNYLFEGRNDQKGEIPPLKSEKILGFIGRHLGLSLSSWVFLMRFLFPALAFLLIYGLFRSLKTSRNEALFWSFMNLMAPYLVYGWYEVFSRPFFRVLRDHGWKFLWFEQYAIATLPWARIVNPQFSGLLFLSALIFLVKIVQGKRTWIWFFPFLILGFVNFRLYFYFWSCLGALLLVIVALSFFFRKIRILVPAGLILFLGLLFGFPQVLSLIKAPESGISSHHPIFSPGCFGALILIIMAMCFFKAWKFAIEDRILFLLMPITVLICMNQNVITGKIVQPWHYELFITPLLLTISLSLIFNRREVLIRLCEALRRKLFQNHRLSLIISMSLFVVLFLCGMILFFYYFKLAPNYIDAMFYIIVGALSILMLIIYFRILLYLIVFSSLPVKRIAYLLGTGLILFIFCSGMMRQAYISIRIKRSALQNQYLALPFKWLLENTPPDSTVLASFEVSECIPLYTHNTVYLCKNAYHEKIISPEHRRERALNYFILTGYDIKSFRSVLAVWPYGYIFWGLQRIEAAKDLYSFSKDNKVPDTVLNLVLYNFEEKKKNDIAEIIKQYRLDYIFWGPSEQKFFKNSPEKIPFIYKVYEDSTPVVIYGVKILHNNHNVSHKK